MKGPVARVKGQGIVVRGSWLVVSILALITYNLQLTTTYAATTSSKELIENAKELDGKRVTYRGEAVTAIMKRGENSWVNLNDGENAIGVWCTGSQAGIIKFLGGYKCQGDMVEVDGIFNRACSIHNGELDIHADKITVVVSGHAVAEQIKWNRLKLSLPLFLITLAIIFLFKKRI